MTGAESAWERVTAFAAAAPIDELCEYSGNTQRYNLELMRSRWRSSIAPEPNHKNQFIGPSDEAFELARRLRDNYGRTEFGLPTISNTPLRGNPFH